MPKPKKIQVMLTRNQQVTRNSEWATQEAFNFLGDDYDLWSELWSQSGGDMNSFAGMVENEIYDQLDSELPNNGLIKSFAQASVQEIDFRRLAERLAEVAQGL